MPLSLLAVNMIAFAVYGADKHRAVRRRWRISEATLILISFLGGGIGALAGMLFFHHKTRKWKFRILVPLSILIWCAMIIYVLAG